MNTTNVLNERLIGVQVELDELYRQFDRGDFYSEEEEAARTRKIIDTFFLEKTIEEGLQESGL